jgi:hypothetical protein
MNEVGEEQGVGRENHGNVQRLPRDFAATQSTGMFFMDIVSLPIAKRRAKMTPRNNRNIYAGKKLHLLH